MEKYCRAGQATDDHMMTSHARCMLDTWGYKHTLTVCNIYCFDRGTMVSQACFNGTSYVRCLPCSVHSMSTPYLPVLSNLLVKPELGAETCVGFCAGVRHCLIWTKLRIVRRFTAVFSSAEFHENPFSCLESYCVCWRMDERSSINILKPSGFFMYHQV